MSPAKGLLTATILLAAFGTVDARTSGIQVVPNGGGLGTDTVWLWNERGAFRHDGGATSTFQEIVRPGGGPLVDVKGLTVSDRAGGKWIWIYTTTALYRHDDGSATSVTEIVDSASASIVDARSVVPAADATSGIDQVIILQPGGVSRHDGGAGTSTTDVTRVGGSPIIDAIGARRLRNTANLSEGDVWIWTPTNGVFRHDMGAGTEADEILNAGGRISGIDGLSWTRPGPGTLELAWIWGPAGFFSSQNVVGSTATDTISFPPPSPNNDVIGMIAFSPPGPGVTALVWKPDGVYAELGAGMLPLTSAGQPIPDVRGLLTALDNSVPIPSGVAWAWTPTGLLRETSQASLLMDAVVNVAGGVPVPDVQGLTVVDDAVSGDPYLVWAWTPTGVFRQQFPGAITVEEVLLPASLGGGPIAGTRSIVTLAHSGVAYVSTDDYVLRSGPGTTVMEELTGPTPTDSIDNTWAVIESRFALNPSGVRTWLWNDEELFLLDTGTNASPVQTASGPIRPHRYDAPWQAVAVIRHDEVLPAAGVVNVPAPVEVISAGAVAAAQVPTSGASAGLVSVTSSQYGSTIVGDVTTLANQFGRSAVLVTFGHEIRGNVFYYRDDMTAAECQGISQPDRRGIRDLAIDVLDACASVILTASTDLDGDYSIRLPSGTYTIRPRKTGDFAYGSDVGILDALWVARDAAGVITLTSPNQEYAATVDINPVAPRISQALAIAQFSAGLLPVFDSAVAIGSDWFTIPLTTATSDRTPITLDPTTSTQGGVRYAPLQVDQVDQDYCAGIFGDVNGDWIPLAVVPRVEKPIPDGPMTTPTISLPTTAGALPGTATTVPLEMDDTSNNLAASLVLDYDAAVALATTVTPTDLLRCHMLVGNVNEAGVVRVAYFRSSYTGDCDPALDPGVGGALAEIGFTSVGSLNNAMVLDLVSADFNTGFEPLDLADGAYCVQGLTSEVTSTRMTKDSENPNVATMTWDGDASAVWYSVYRGPDAGDLGCVEAAVPTTITSDDGSVPPMGAVWSYGVAAANCRGESSLGQDSSGNPRLPSAACP
jgi:hypothetical protein